MEGQNLTARTLAAGAVVVETSSAISHASIVARELGIPAAASLTNATRLIPDGTMITVDGDTGTWEIPYFGVFHYIAGTGKYKAIRGGGYYKGLVTPTSNAGAFVCEAEY